MKNKRIIKKNFEFQKIISHQKTLKNSSFILYYLPSNETGAEHFFRYGVTVSQKIGNVPQRNKVKRQIRHMLQMQLLKYGNLQYQVVIIAKLTFLEKKFFENNQNLDKLLHKLSTLDKKGN